MDVVIPTKSPRHPCAAHNSEQVAFFCRDCLKTTCSQCLEVIHNGHDVIPLKAHQRGLAKRLREMKENMSKIGIRLNVLDGKSKKICPVSTELKESINKRMNDSMQALENEHMKLMQEVERIESACKGDVWTLMSDKLTKCSSMLGKEDSADGYYDNITEFEKAMEAVTLLQDAVSDEGVLTCLDNLEVKFVPTPEISLGHIEEPTGWRLVKKIDLPKPRAGRLHACIALGGSRVAVGYGLNIGVEIIGYEEMKNVQLLKNVDVRDLSKLSDEKIIVNDKKGGLNIYSVNKNGDRSNVDFVTSETNKHTYISVDSHYNIYLATAEDKVIEVFDQSGGVPFKTIKTELQPWIISVMKTGHIIVTQTKTGIKVAAQVIDTAGKVVRVLPGIDNYTPYSTCDENDNIYIALKHKDSGSVMITKYSPYGEKLETITQGVPTTTARRWIRMSCISPTKLALCDLSYVHIFQRRPALSQIMKLMM